LFPGAHFKTPASGIHFMSFASVRQEWFSRRMQKCLKIVLLVAGANLLCFWVFYGLLMAAWPHVGLSQFLGILPAPPRSYWILFLLSLFTVLGFPGLFLLDGVESEHYMILMVLCSVLNCMIWGVCIGVPMFAICRRFHHAVA